MSTQKTAANGVAKNNPSPAVTKPELSNVVVDKGTGELQPVKVDPAKAQKPSIEEIFNRMDELEELRDKRSKVVAHLENLNRFYIDPSGNGCNLRLTDSRNNSFGIAHPSVIGEIIHMSTEKMQDELTRIENQISAFF